MKNLSLLISIFFFSVIIFLSYLNVSNIITIEFLSYSLKANVGLLILSSAILSNFATLLFYGYKTYGVNTKKLQKKVEENKLKHEIESDKVKQLEAKIKTLEIALDKLSR